MRSYAAAVALLGCALPLRAQTPERPTVSVRGDGAAVWLRRETTPGVVSRLRGPALGADARVNYGPFSLGVGLLEGRLDDGTGTGTMRDLVEGRVVAAVRALPWLEVGFGPLLRAYVTDSATERWVMWQGRARVEAPILVTSLTSYVEGWRALSSRVTQPPLAAGRVQGGEAGVTYRPPRGPVWLRLAYRVDNALLDGGSETVEAVSFSVGVGR